MPSMTKRVNVYAQVAVRNVTPPIYGTCKNIVMTTGDILKCLCKRARVEEILPDGKTIRLNMSNYYTDNGAGLDASKSVTKEVKKVENPARFKVPVAPKAQVVETKTEDANDVHAGGIVGLVVEAEPVINNCLNISDEAVVENTSDVLDTKTEVEVVKEVEEICEAQISAEEIVSETEPVMNDTSNTSNTNNNHHHKNKKKK